MKIHQILISRHKLHFHAPFKIAYEEVSEAEVIIIQLNDEHGNIGLGSASPDTEVTGETIDEVFQILNKRLTKEFFEHDLNSWYRYHEKIQNTFAGLPSAQSAAEEAFLNLWSGVYKIPLARFFGGSREACDTMITIGIKPLRQTLQEVKKRLGEGFKIIKLKCGLDIKDDLKKVQEVQKIFP